MVNQTLIPSIGARGYFQIADPFATASGALFTCKAIRKLSEYISVGDDPYALIYAPAGASEADYEKDLRADMAIVGLQSDNGYWHYFPSRCLIAHPDASGVPYRSLGVHIALPAMPVDRDLKFLTKDLQDYIKDRLGVNSNISLVETSQTILVSKERHELEQVARATVAASAPTAHARVRQLENDAGKMLKQIALLEAYILARHKPESADTYIAQKDLGAYMMDMQAKQKVGLTIISPGETT